MLQKTVALILPLFILTSCGGGSGSTAAPVQPPLPVQPTLPVQPPLPVFSVTSSTPADGKTEVLRSETPRVDFSVTPEPNSITNTSIQLVGPSGNVIPMVTTINSTSVSLRPTLSNLPGGTKYTINAASNVTDINGRKLSGPFKSTFTTASQNWGATTTIIATLPYFYGGTQPTIAADVEGNITAVWKASIVGKDTVFASRLNAKSGIWSAATALYSGNSSGAFGPLSLSVGSNQDAYLIWKNYGTGSDFTFHGMRFNFATNSWSKWAEFDVSHLLPSGIGLNGTSVYPDAIGNLTFISSTDLGIFATRFDIAKATWTAPQRLDDPIGGSYLFGVDAIVDRSGNVTATWIQSYGLQIAHFSIATKSWSAPYLLDDSLNTNGPTKYYSMGSDNNGNVSIVWGHGAGISGVPTIRAARFDFSSSKWSKQTQLDDGKSVFGAYDASIVVDPLGNLVVVWTQYEGLYSAKYGLNNSTWSAPEKIISANPSINGRALLSNPDIAGNFTLLFLSNPNVMASQYVASVGQWQTPMTIDNLSSGIVVGSNLPVIVSDLSGNVTAVWFAQNNTLGTSQGVVTANRFK
jgi:hypothetical protein